MAPPRWLPVWLFVPNLIGYVRLALAVAAFANTAAPDTFFVLYFFSYALDALDGVAARALKQTSRFGAVLDMVADRACTAALLGAIASAAPDAAHIAYYAMMLDIISHWAQMYSSMLAGAASHKSMDDEWPVVKFYYAYPYALFFVCLLNETFLACAFLEAHVVKTGGSIDPAAHAPVAFMYEPVHVLQRIGVAVAAPPLFRVLMYACFPVAVYKQIASVAQLVTAARRVLRHDEAARASSTA